MKVLHVIPAVAPRYGGPSQAILELCAALAERGITAEIATTDADGPARLPVELGKPVTYQGVRCHFFRRDCNESFKFSRSLKRWLDENVAHYDLVHVHAVFSHATHAAARACWRHRVPYIVRPLGTLEPWSMSQKRGRKLVAWHFFFHRVLDRAAAVHYTTEQEREWTEPPLGLRRGIVVPNGVPERLVQTSRPLPGNSPALLALSRIHPKKGLDVLLKAFVQLKSDGQLDGWRLVIAGDGERDYVEQLQGIARSTKAEPFVHWPGWLQGESKFVALREASLFVLSSHQENFGIGVLEAMACGTPVLVSRQVGLAGAVAEAKAGWVVELDADGIRHGLLEAAGNPSELLARGIAARELVKERFTWPRIAGDWISRYETILAQTQKSSLVYA